MSLRPFLMRLAAFAGVGRERVSQIGPSACVGDWRVWSGVVSLQRARRRSSSLPRRTVAPRGAGLVSEQCPGECWLASAQDGEEGLFDGGLGVRVRGCSGHAGGAAAGGWCGAGVLHCGQAHRPRTPLWDSRLVKSLLGGRAAGPAGPASVPNRGACRGAASPRYRGGSCGASGVVPAHPRLAPDSFVPGSARSAARPEPGSGCGPRADAGVA